MAPRGEVPEAVLSADDFIAAAIEQTGQQDPSDALTEYFAGLITMLDSAGWRPGGTMAAVAGASPITWVAGGASYRQWLAAFQARRADPGSHRDLLLLAAAHGALVVARAWLTIAPITVIANEINTLLAPAESSG